MRQSAKPNGLNVCHFTDMVLNADLSAERREGNGNNSARFTDSSIGGRTPGMAT
jgi:hypothetical protein